MKSIGVPENRRRKDGRSLVLRLRQLGRGTRAKQRSPERFARRSIAGKRMGTRVALHWMTEHPESIERAVASGVRLDIRTPTLILSGAIEG